eukprot:COSAG01_NODE_1161_length_11459_cov_47.466549_4_plen_133_part_00
MEGRQANGILLLVGWGFDWWTRWQPAHLRFEVFTPKGYSSYSKVTVPEDVSYVTSPFMIGALRRSQDVPLTNNAERAAVRKITIQTLHDWWNCMAVAKRKWCTQEAARGAHTMKVGRVTFQPMNIVAIICEW